MPILFPAQHNLVPPDVVPFTAPTPAHNSTATTTQHTATSGEWSEENVFWTEFQFRDRNVTVLALKGEMSGERHVYMYL